MYVEIGDVLRPGSVCRSLTWTHLEEKIFNILPQFSEPYIQPCKAKILNIVGHVDKGAGYLYQKFQTFIISGSSNTNLSM